jgi:hypothetical protein
MSDERVEPALRGASSPSRSQCEQKQDGRGGPGWLPLLRAALPVRSLRSSASLPGSVEP